MNQTQRKILVERTERALRLHRSALYYRSEKNTEPANVKAARALIKKFEDQERKKADAKLEKVEAARKATEEAVHFGDEKTALAAVQKLEAAKF